MSKTIAETAQYITIKRGDGGIADNVHEVIEREADQINPPPRIAMRWRTELIQGNVFTSEDSVLRDTAELENELATIEE